MLLADQSTMPDAWDIIRPFLNALPMLWPMLAVLLVLAAGGIAIGVFRRHRLARSGMGDIDRMGGRTFEQYLEVMFSRLGYRVVRTRFTGDYGGDLVLSKDGTRTVVQAKRWTKSVGVRAVQEAVAAKGQYDCSEAMVVTNSSYTKQAVHLARKNRVVLWDRNELATRLLRTRAKESSAAPEKPAETHSVQTAVSADPRPAAALPNEPRPAVETCAICAKVLTPGERAFCASHSQRFAGKMLCFRHQRTVRRS